MKYRLSLKKARWRYLNLYAASLYFTHKVLDRTWFARFSETISEELNTDEETIKEFLLPFFNQRLTEEDLKRLAWFLAVNQKSLADISESASYEPVAYQIRYSQLDPDAARLICITDILSGPLAGQPCRLSVRYPTYLFRVIYPKLKRTVSIRRYDLLDGLLFYAVAKPLRDLWYLVPKTLTVSPSMRKINRKMLDVRVPLRQSAMRCARGGDTFCCHCSLRCDGRPVYLIS